VVVQASINEIAFPSLKFAFLVFRPDFAFDKSSQPLGTLQCELFLGLSQVKTMVPLILLLCHSLCFSIFDSLAFSAASLLPTISDLFLFLLGTPAQHFCGNRIKLTAYYVFFFPPTVIMDSFF